MVLRPGDHGWQVRCVGGSTWVFVGDCRQQQGRTGDRGVAEEIMVLALGGDHGCTRRIREERRWMRREGGLMLWTEVRGEDRKFLFCSGLRII